MEHQKQKQFKKTEFQELAPNFMNFPCRINNNKHFMDSNIQDFIGHTYQSGDTINLLKSAPLR